MKLYTYLDGGESKIGVSLEEDKLHSISDFGLTFSDMNDLIARITEDELALLRNPQNAKGPAIAVKSVQLCAPIKPEQDVICLGINYSSHAAESERFHKEAFPGNRPQAIYFSKRVAVPTGDGDAIPSYEGLVDSLDYEAELAVIIGRDAKQVSEDDAADYIFGYTVLNDVSARNLQTDHSQWYFGKSLDGFTPIGPCILTADEVSFPPALEISSVINGEVRQKSNTSLLIHTIAEVLSELSQGMTLKAGTIISTGTPSGVGMGFTPPKFLKKGDTVICTIEKIGSITNQVE